MNGYTISRVLRRQIVSVGDYQKIMRIKYIQIFYPKTFFIKFEESQIEVVRTYTSVKSRPWHTILLRLCRQKRTCGRNRCAWHNDATCQQFDFTRNLRIDINSNSNENYSELIKKKWKDYKQEISSDFVMSTFF